MQGSNSALVGSSLPQAVPLQDGEGGRAQVCQFLHPFPHSYGLRSPLGGGVKGKAFRFGILGLLGSLSDPKGLRRSPLASQGRFPPLQKVGVGLEEAS